MSENANPTPNPANEAAPNPGATAQTPAPAAPAPPPAAVAPPEPGPDTVLIPRADYQKILADMNSLSEFRAREAERAAKAEADKIKAIAEKEGVEAALKAAKEAEAAKLKERDDRIAALNGQYAAEKKAAALASLTAGTVWASKAAADAALRDLGDRFDSVQSADGTWLVVEKATRRPADQVVPELLKSESYAFYQKATTTGGTGSAGAHRAAPSAPVEKPVDPAYAALQKSLQQRQGAPGLAGSFGRN